jgi:hypothetical protein
MEPEIIPNIKDDARAMAQKVLSSSASFMNMPLEDQRSIYLDLVNENMDKLAKQFAGGSNPLFGQGQLPGISPGGFEEMINARPGGPKRPNQSDGSRMGFEGYNPAFEDSVDAFEDLVDSVDFPQFVTDLLKGVFDANLSVMKQQTDAYIKLMKEATKSVADFVKQINEDDALASLAENKPDMYNIAMDEIPEGGQKMVLTTPTGERVNMDDNQVKAKVMEAKIAMAKEHRAALREVILMGVTRLVVEKGKIEAGVEFNITAKRNSDKSRKTQNINTLNQQKKLYSHSGFLGMLSPSGSQTESNTNISVSTSNKKAEDTLTAKLMGKVDIQFKTDYFSLDNFLTMYGDGGIAQLKKDGQGQTALPPK